MDDILNSKLSRIKYPHFYSDNFDSAIEEFRIDISKYYVAGYTYDEILNDKDLIDTNKYLNHKFRRSNKPFPFLNRFADYIFTRDESINLFGKWFSFNYLDPLKVLEFAQFKRGNNQKITLRNLASFIFLLFQFHEITDRSEILKLRRDLNKKKYDQWEKWKTNKGNIILVSSGITYKNGVKTDLSSFGWRKLSSKSTSKKLSDTQKDTLKILQQSGLQKNKVVIIPAPKRFYKMIGFTSNRHVDIYSDFLRLKYVHNKFRENEYFSRYLISGIDKLKKEYDYFINKKSEAYDNLLVNLEDKLSSGYKLNDYSINQANYIYNTAFARNKKRFQCRLHLENNPLIRVKNYNDNFLCSIQADFFNYDFLLSSLYIKKNKTYSTFKEPLKEYLESLQNGKELKDVIKRSIKKIDEENIQSLLNVVSNDIKRITSPLDRRRNLHVTQIEKARILLNEKVSPAGIPINIKKAEALKKDLIREYNLNSDTVWEDAKKDSYDIKSNSEINEIYGREKTNNIEDKIREIENILSNNNILPQITNNILWIYGVFIPHGAASGRMTCRDLNLQGLSKYVRDNIICPPPGKVILSADVSGQDITVAANLAKKLYSDKNHFDSEITREFDFLNSKINLTLRKLHNSGGIKHIPIDFIANEISLMTSPLLIDIQFDKVRKLVKESIYTYFYGGTKNSFTNISEKEKELISDLDEFKKACVNFERSLTFSKGLRTKNKFNRKIKKDSIETYLESFDEFIINFRENYFPLLNSNEIPNYEEDLVELEEDLIAYKDAYINIDSNNEDNTSLRDFIFEQMNLIMLREYPGLIESFSYYEKYYENSNLTYPSLLGFQTPAVLKYNKGDVITRSKCYPIQASGAEFIRQWLIEIYNVIPKALQKDNCFHVINLIHDQIMVLVDEELADKMKKHILKSAEKASKNVGLIPDTLHILEVKAIYHQNS